MDDVLANCNEVLPTHDRAVILRAVFQNPPFLISPLVANNKVEILAYFQLPVPYLTIMRLSTS